jgi:phosphorylcholine metabolism protein LicD
MKLGLINILRLPPLNEKLAINNLREVKEILDKYNIRYWLDHGSLLGAVREGKIIEGDSDIDLGTMFESTKQIVSTFPEFREKGFSVFLDDKYCTSNGISIHRFGHEIGISLYCSENDNAWFRFILGKNLFAMFSHLLVHLLSIRVYPKAEKIFASGDKLRSLIYRLAFRLPISLRQSSRHLVWSIFKRVGGKVYLLMVPKTYFEKLRTVEFYGMRFSIPSDAEGYLEYHYGKDWKTPKKEWKTPKKDWDWTKEDGAVKTLITQ